MLYNLVGDKLLPAIATMIDTQFYLLGFLSFISLTFIIISFVNQTSKPVTTHLRLPPSPPSLPVIGHLHHLYGAPLCKSLQSLSTQYGPLLYLRLAAVRCLVVSSASMAAEIFKTHDFAFASRTSFAFAKELPLGNLGLFPSPNGNYWKFMKKLCMTEMLSPKQLERSHAIRREEIVQFVHVVLENANKKEVFDVGDELMRLTNNIVSRMLMSTRCSEKGDEADRITELVKESFKVYSKMCFGDALGPLKRLAFWLYGKQAMDLNMRYDEILERMLKQREEGGKRDENKDLMDVLLKVYQDDKAEIKITRTHIKALLLDLFAGGTGTAAEAMQWTIAELINHPKVFNKVREEIKSVAGARLVEESDIRSLPYLRAVVKETLRLYPPGPIAPRECCQSCKIRGFDVSQKTMVIVNLYAIMRDPALWDNPNEFRPERFLVSSKEQDNLDFNQNETEEQNFSFIPFGGGRKSCPGSTLALNMMHATIATMVQCFDWKFAGEGDNAKINMQVGGGFSLPMANPLICLPVIHFNPFVSSRQILKNGLTQ